MATPRLCSIQDCDKPAHRRGWCWRHHNRWKKYGDPLAGGPFLTPKGEPSRFLNESVLNFSGDDCLIWPYSRNMSGYGQINLDGTPKIVSRVVCERTYGPPPTTAHEAAHLCGGGHRGCVNPRHLAWKTPVENRADKLIHDTHNRGERHYLSKLTESDVREIRRRRGVESQRALGERFGVAHSQIWRIQTGHGGWDWLD